MASYDYIIIGAGSAGCVLANRLTTAKHRVLLLEAGGKDKDSNIHIPAGFPKLFKGECDWAFHSIPQKHMKERALYQPRGKVLGGCSSINAMIYIRGNKKDYDDWAALGNKGWSFDEVFPYFKKSEGQQDIKNEFHNSDGPLSVMNRNYTNPLSDIFLQAGKELGYPINSDFNGANQEGFGMYQVTHRNGARCSTAVAYLRPVEKESNLQIETNALVHRITIENQKATGVVYEQNGQQKTVTATKEVLLSAGAFNSPQLLMLSGVGDGDELKKQGIEVKKHLTGVGKNLQDHLVYFSIFDSSYKNTLDAAERFPIMLKHLANYVFRKKGPFSTNIGEAGAFVKSNPAEEAPDTQYHFGPGYFMEHGFRNPTSGNGYSIGGKVLVPKSRGTVSISSSNPTVAPVIDPNYLSHEEDIRKSVWGFKLAQRIGKTKAFQPYFKDCYEPNKILTDDLEIEDQIKKTAETLYHPIGTCKMGSDEMAVVDDQLRVHGIQNLRVVDASIMPIITRGNTNAPTIMIAEKAADLILGKNNVV